MPRSRLGEIQCPNCHQRLSIWQNKRGSGFVSCGLCGYHATNIQVDGNPDEGTEQKFSVKVNSKTLMEVKDAEDTGDLPIVQGHYID